MQNRIKFHDIPFLVFRLGLSASCAMLLLHYFYQTTLCYITNPQQSILLELLIPAASEYMVLCLTIGIAGAVFTDIYRRQHK